MSIVDDEVLAMVGVKGSLRVAPLPLDASTLRRFVHGVMEGNPVHWDEASAQASRYGQVVAPPLWPSHAFVRPSGAHADPLEQLNVDADWDGAAGELFGQLPPVPISLGRLLNGGTSAEFYQLPTIGDVISAQSEYVEIVEREGRTGPMVIVRVLTVYKNQHDHLLSHVTNSLIYR
ncbi:hypothetical protein AU252_01580 [Pseudarthrobacter sulfonivorans]|uniref:FAS1-like dehydratase domain-containing protein n=1 Tax=Pseudarthrobacter sulfonivorans TaxID=121292 RepID=A0A0U2X7M4_9MICC|nr:MaoC family dehydratase N-terminal domain-containing protein [Pseudarthrobacter sulfonivorans]ALV40018.1 hypothetical protein AU252_01580 [Pseudarthrobacter sulfonivorans]